MPRVKIDKFIETARPWIKRLEFFIKPRLSFITQGIFSYLIGLAGIVMALSIAVPLPLTNTVPALGITLMSVGILMRDGLAVIGGMFIGLVWIALLLGLAIIFGSEAFDIMKDFIKGFLS